LRAAFRTVGTECGDRAGPEDLLYESLAASFEAVEERLHIDLLGEEGVGLARGRE
jgi:hypothetical protein